MSTKMTPDQIVEEYQKAVAEGKTNRAAYFQQIMVDNNIAMPEPEVAIAVADEPGMVESAARGVAQGATFGFSDEITAGLEAAFTDTPYQEALADTRSQYQAAQQANPWTYGIGEFGGGFAVPGLGAVKGAGALARMGSRLPAAGRLAISGAGAGGLAGAGYSEGEDALEVARDTAVGAGLGGVLAPVGAAVLNQAGRLGSNLVGGVRRRLAGTPDDQARLRLARALEAEDMSSVDAVRGALDDLGPEGRLADLGPTIRQEAVTAAKSPGPARRLAQDFVDERASGQQARLNEAARDALDPRWDDYRQFLDDVTTQRQAQAGPLYDEAYSVPIRPTPEMNRLSLTPAFQDAARSAQTTVRNELAEMGAPTGLQADGSISTLFADQIGRELKDAADAAARAGRGNLARQIGNIRRRFNDEIYQQNPTLREARGVFAGAKELENAAEAGRDLLFGRKTYADDLEVMLREFTDSETEAFRIGLTRGIFDKISDAGETHDAARRLINSTRVRDLLEVAMNDADNPDAFRNFMNAVNAEQGMHITRQKIVGGSPTFENIRADQQRIEAIERGGIVGWLDRIYRHLGAEDVDLDKLTPEDHAAMTEYLFGDLTDQQIQSILTPTMRSRVASGPASEGRLAGPGGIALTQSLIGDL